MPTEPIDIPKSKVTEKRNEFYQRSMHKRWNCEKHSGCMWSYPCDCRNCSEYNRVYKITK